MNSDESRYQEALDYIYSFVDYSRDRSQRYSAEAFDLARMRRLLDLVGNPHESYPTVLIAGTKGKGSVAAMLASCYQSAGYRTGLYTSPHLVSFGERIQVNGTQIPSANLVELVEMIKPAMEAVPEITTYELITALGFLHFHRSRVGVGVIEVGLGGRLDATNVLSPIVSVITHISFDHTGILGESLTEIATEKAGIIRASTPVVMAPQSQEAADTIEAIAGRREAPLVDVAREWSARVLNSNLDGQHIEILHPADKGRPALQLRVPLLGPHQVTNALTAVAALTVTRENGLQVADEAIRSGFSGVEWPGRFQVLARSPMVIADAAHNRASASVLRETFEAHFPERRPLLVFGASEDKDVAGMLDELAPACARLIATQAFHPRAIEPDRICEMANRRGLTCDIRTPVSEAVRYALRSVEKDGLILITGSLFVVGELLDAWSELAHVLGQPAGVD